MKNKKIALILFVLLPFAAMANNSSEPLIIKLENEILLANEDKFYTYESTTFVMEEDSIGFVFDDVKFMMKVGGVINEEDTKFFYLNKDSKLSLGYLIDMQAETITLVVKGKIFLWAKIKEEQ